MLELAPSSRMSAMGVLVASGGSEPESLAAASSAQPLIEPEPAS